MDQGIARRRRRRHSPEFKAEAVAACRKPGVSIAAAALSRSINANLLRRWVLEVERTEAAPWAGRSRLRHRMRVFSRCRCQPSLLMRPRSASRCVEGQ